VFRWEMRVAGVHSSPGLMWTTSAMFYIHVLSVIVCAAI